MKNDEILERIGAYRDGELDDETRAQVAEELKSCEASQAAYRELEAMDALVERAVLEPAAAADLTGFTDEVMARIAAEVAPEPARIEEGTEAPRSARRDVGSGGSRPGLGWRRRPPRRLVRLAHDPATLDVTPEAVRSGQRRAGRVDTRGDRGAEAPSGRSSRRPLRVGTRHWCSRWRWPTVAWSSTTTPMILTGPWSFGIL